MLLDQAVEIQEFDDNHNMLLWHEGDSKPNKLKMSNLNNKVYTYDKNSEIAKIIPYYRSEDGKPYDNSVMFSGYGFGNKSYKLYDGYCVVALDYNEVLRMQQDYARFSSKGGASKIQMWDAFGVQIDSAGHTFIKQQDKTLSINNERYRTIAAYGNSTQLFTALDSRQSERMFLIAGESGNNNSEYTQLLCAGNSVLSSGSGYTTISENGYTVMHIDGIRNWAHSREFFVGSLNTSAQDVRGAINELQAKSGGNNSGATGEEIDYYKARGSAYLEGQGTVPQPLTPVLQSKKAKFKKAVIELEKWSLPNGDRLYLFVCPFEPNGTGDYGNLNAKNIITGVKLSSPSLTTSDFHHLQL